MSDLTKWSKETKDGHEVTWLSKLADRPGWAGVVDGSLGCIWDENGVELDASDAFDGYNLVLAPTIVDTKYVRQYKHHLGNIFNSKEDASTITSVVRLIRLDLFSDGSVIAEAEDSDD